MANKKIFLKRLGVPTNTRNEAGAPAYSLTDKHALAQYIVTSCFNDVFYASAEEQATKIAELCSKVESDFLAKAAVYGREVAKMKDTPAYALAYLVSRGENALVAKVFNRVINNSKMLGNFVQIIRSGAVGRRSFGTATKRLIQNWLTSRNADRLFADSIGNSNPSLSDIVKMAHPRATSVEQNTMFAYLIGKPLEGETRNPELLPARVRAFEELKAGREGSVDNLDFRLLSNLSLNKQQWEQVALSMPWYTLRMNLNTLHRNGVFENEDVVRQLAARLCDPEQVKKANAFPYQLLTTYQNISDEIPAKLRLALQDAMEIAVQNVPQFEGGTAICTDISGSMGSPITGHREGSTTKTRCIDVASLITSVIMRSDPESCLVGYDGNAKAININPRDSIMTNCQNIATHARGGSTNSTAAMRFLNDKGVKCRNVIFVSDNMSWMDYYGRGMGNKTESQTPMSEAWHAYTKRVPNAKLVLIDIQPYANTQVPESKNVLNVGGFNDAVFSIMDGFLNGRNTDFVKTIEAVRLEPEAIREETNEE